MKVLMKIIDILAILTICLFCSYHAKNGNITQTIWGCTVLVTYVYLGTPKERKE